MIKQTILCDYCEAELAYPKKYIIINGRIHYCDEDCQNQMQERCLKETNHSNSVKDLTGGECLDCGEIYNVD